MGKGDNVVLHIGLHKTGTRYLQRLVFGQLDTGRFSVNPPHVWQPLRNAMRHPGDNSTRRAAEAAVAEWRTSDDRRTLIISEPHICGDMYSGYHDYAQNLELIHELFPQARIIFVVRNQADWLHSAYRQHLVRGRAVPIETFLNYFDGRFHSRPGRKVAGTRNLEALKLPFLDIYRAYASAYGTESTYLLRHEDMRSDKQAFDRALAACLDVERLPDPPTERAQNRSYSALAIGLFHPATQRRPQPVSALPPQRGRGLLRPVTGQLRRLRRAFIQHVFDRLIYVDHDLLQRNGMREAINHHYAKENEQIRRIAHTILERGPQGITEREGRPGATADDE